MAKRRVLVVEDDAAIRRGIVDALTFEGYETHDAGTFAEGLRMGIQMSVDAILLDLVLPDGHGLDLLREVRSVRPGAPILILTALGQEDDRIRGLRLGADDYVVKPFSVRELLARVEAVLRRSAERPKDVAMLSLPLGTVDFASHTLRFPDGSSTEISEREGELLRYLASHPGRVISREELLERVWRLPSSLVRTRTVDMHVARLREKLRDDAGTLIVTVRGRGYSFQSGEGP